MGELVDLAAYKKQKEEQEEIEFKNMGGLRGAKQFADAIYNGWSPSIR